MVPVLGQLAELEVVGDAVHAPGLRHRLERADQELAGVLLDVQAAVRIAQHRQIRRHLGHGLGQHVEVLAGVQRHAHAGHAADLAAPHPGAVDHHLGADRTELGLDAGHPAARRVMPVTLQPSMMRAPFWRAPLASAWAMSIGFAWPSAGMWMAPARSPTSISGYSSLASAGDSSWTSRPQARPIAAWRLSSVEAALGAREADAAVLLEAGRLPGLGLEPEVQLGGILREPRQVGRRAQLPDQPGGVPGRAAGQLLALEQHHLAPAELGQMVGDRAADHPAADDHRLRVAGRISSHDVLSLAPCPWRCRRAWISGIA